MTSDKTNSNTSSSSASNVKHMYVIRLTNEQANALYLFFRDDHSDTLKHFTEESRELVEEAIAQIQDALLGD